MPFLRAALLKKKLAEQPEPEQEEILQPHVIVEEQNEPEDDIEDSQFDTLRGILDERDKEADTIPEIVSEVQQEIEIPAVEIPAVEIEIPVTEVQTDEPVTEILNAEETHEFQADVPQIEHDIETETAEEFFTETDEIQQDIVTDTETAAESFPEVLPDLGIDTETEIEIIPEPVEDIPEEPQIETAEPLDAEPEIEEIKIETETPAQQEQQESADDFDENSLLNEPSAPQPETESALEPESESESESQSESEPEPESESEPLEPEPSKSGSEDFALKYDFTSGERYVDKVSTKTEFDKMLDELAEISKELLGWQTDKFARDFTNRFQEETQAEARKYEAFLGGYITNAAMLLYDKGYRDAALKQLEQAKSILEARKKLEDETSAIKSRVEEQNDVVDLSDILGLFGDG